MQSFYNGVCAEIPAIPPISLLISCLSPEVTTGFSNRDSLKAIRRFIDLSIDFFSLSDCPTRVVGTLPVLVPLLNHSLPMTVFFL